MFSIESKFYRLTIYIYHLVLVNFLFIVTSVLIVSLPASFLSLVATIKQIERPGIVKGYFRNFKRVFFQTIPLGLFNVFSVLFAISIQSIQIESSLFLKLIVSVFLFFLFSYNVNLYLILNLFEKKINYYQVFQQSFIWSLGSFYQNILLLVGLFGLYLLFFFQFPIALSLYGVSVPVFAYTKLFDYQLMKAQGN